MLAENWNVPWNSHAISSSLYSLILVTKLRTERFKLDFIVTLGTVFFLYSFEFFFEIISSLKSAKNVEDVEMTLFEMKRWSKLI